MKSIKLIISMFCISGLTAGYAIAQSCHGGGGSGGHSERQQSENNRAGSNVEIMEQFETSVYTCPMHPEVKEGKSGRCPKCGMKLEKTEMLMTYACPEKDCGYQKRSLRKCPVHLKELVKCEVKSFCPKCGEQINPEDLIRKPVKPVKDEVQNIVTPAEKKVQYICPMHPEVRQDKPGRCPKCGMNLVPAK